MLAFIFGDAGALAVKARLATTFVPKRCNGPQPQDAITNINAFVKRRTQAKVHMCTTSTDDATSTGGKLGKGRDPRTTSDDEWRQVLTSEEFRVIRQKGTEYPGTGEYDGFYPENGHFICRACGNPLYSAQSKFKSGCGWPAFDLCYENSVSIIEDTSLNMRRIEILCAKCSGHLGHIFKGERMTPTNERHCVNSLSVKYVPGNPPDLNEVKLL